MVTGRVSGFQQRLERPLTRDAFRPITVWSFRLEREDDQGQPLPRAAVEMRGSGFEGTIETGDWVRIDDEWSPGAMLRPRRLLNLTTNSEVSVRGESQPEKTARMALGIVGALFFLAIMAFVIYGFATNLT